MPRTRLRSALAGRGFMLLPAAALGVHELRYRLAYGADAPQALAAQGHGYLDSLAPWLVLLLALALRRLPRPLRPRRRRSAALDARDAVVRRPLAALDGEPRRRLRRAGAARRASSPPGHPAGSPASSVTAAGGRSLSPRSPAPRSQRCCALQARPSMPSRGCRGHARPAVPPPRCAARPSSWSGRACAPLASAAAGRAPPPARTRASPSGAVAAPARGARPRHRWHRRARHEASSPPEGSRCQARPGRCRRRPRAPNRARRVRRARDPAAPAPRGARARPLGDDRARLRLRLDPSTRSLPGRPRPRARRRPLARGARRPRRRSRSSAASCGSRCSGSTRPAYGSMPARRPRPPTVSSPPIGPGWIRVEPRQHDRLARSPARPAACQHARARRAGSRSPSRSTGGRP